MQPASSKVYTVELETIQLDTEKAQQEIPPYTTPWHILLACLLVLVPITVVTTLLIMFVSWARWTLYDPDYTRPDLPIARLDSSSFNTVVFASKVILVSSWSSNIAQFATAPFMLIFSFLVARDLASRPKLAGAENEDEKGLLQRNNYNLLKWLSGGQHRSTGQECIGRNATRIAGYGALISLFLTVALVLGDKWLQACVSSVSHTLYDNVYNTTDIGSSMPYGMKLREGCYNATEATQTYNVSRLPPCSINHTAHPWTLNNVQEVYRIIETGMLNFSSKLQTLDFDRLNREWTEGSGSDTQVLTYETNVTKEHHAFLFNLASAQEMESTQKRGKLDVSTKDIEHYGFDYVAQTVSVVTKCTPNTITCGMKNITTHNNNSVPNVRFNCPNSMFEGNAEDTPENGIEQVRGWWTKFYNLENGTSHEIGMSSQLNPFTYDITMVLDSFPFQGLVNLNDSQVPSGMVVDAGNGRVAAAVSCSSSVYNVEYSFVNGSIHNFKPTLASAAEASVIKAPLQAGFGSYALYQKASMAMLMTNVSLAEPLSLSLSEMALALAQGPYVPVDVIAYRVRGDVTVTNVPKAPFCFLVLCLILYALVIVVFTVIALSMRRSDELLATQADLVPWQPLKFTDIMSMAKARVSEWGTK